MQRLGTLLVGANNERKTVIGHYARNGTQNNKTQDLGPHGCTSPTEARRMADMECEERRGMPDVAQVQG